MPYFVLYTALLLLGCFFVGAWFACVMRRMTGIGDRPALATAGAGAGVGAVAARAALDDVPVETSVTSAGSLFGDRSEAEQAQVDTAALSDDPLVDAEHAAEPEAVEAPTDESVVADNAVADEPSQDASADEVLPSPDMTADATEEVQSSPEVSASPDVSAIDEPEEQEASVEVSSDLDDADAPAGSSETTDVASAVAAASAAAAAAVAAAKAGAAAQLDDEDVTTAAAAVAPEAVVFEDILPSPDEDGFTFAERADVEAVSDLVDDEAAVQDVAPVEAASDLEVISVDDAEVSAVHTEHATESGETATEDTVSGASDTALGSALAAGLAARAATADPVADEPSIPATSTEPADKTQEVAAPVVADDLMRIKGVDAETQSTLNDAGISSYEQISSLSSRDVHDLDQKLGGGMRVSRESWIEQATVLATGRETYFSKRQYRKQTSSGSNTASGSLSPEADTASSIATGVAAVGGVTGAAVAAAAVESAPTEAREPRADREPREPREPRADREPREPREPRADREPREAREPREDREPRKTRSGSERQSSGLLGAVSSRLRGGKEARKVPGVGTPEQRRVGGGGRMLQSTEADDLKRIRGVGVVIEKKLNAMGVHSYAQIAEWTEADIEKVNGILDFSGRIERENWIEQAKMLAASA